MSPLSPSSLFLMDRKVHTYPAAAADDDTGSSVQGRVLSTGPKLAFGFNADYDADSVVRGLMLEARLAGAPDLSSLILRGGNLSTCIHTVDGNLLLIATTFTQLCPWDVLLVYDAVDRSLHMIPMCPDTAAPFFVYPVLVARRNDDDWYYVLVNPGREFVSLSDDGVAQWRDVLFLSPSSSASPWKTTKKANFPEHPLSGFYADEVFSSCGRGYWADLLRGVMYCHCTDVLSDDIDYVDIYSLDLPSGCPKYFGPRKDIAQSRAFRAMGRVGDSVKFITIDGYLERLDDLADFKVRVWRLMEAMDWTLEYEVKLGSLWEEAEFKGNGVPMGMAPMYPLFSMQQDQEDHAIYFALGEYIQGVYNCFPTHPRCLVRVDMHTKTFSCTDLPLSRSSIDSLVALSGGADGNLLGLSG